MRKILPPFNVPLTVYGDCFQGEWHCIGYAVPYKKGSRKSQLKKVYRWLDENGNIIDGVDGWRSRDKPEES